MTEDTPSENKPNGAHATNGHAGFTGLFGPAPSLPAFGLVGPFRSAAEYRNYSLTLYAIGIAHDVQIGPQGIYLRVAESDLAKAEDAIAKMRKEQEARRFSLLQSTPFRLQFSLIPFVVAGVLIALYFATHGTSLVDRGTADDVLILRGQIYRLVTSLTLHADESHVLGNSFWLIVLFTLLIQRVGGGVAVATTLFSGIFGTLANSLAHAAGGLAHRTIGASTALFGVVGLLAGIQAVYNRRSFTERTFRNRISVVFPIVGALGILAMIGVGGGRTDIWAHLFGMISGIFIGIAVGWISPEKLRTPRLQVGSALASVAVIMASWAFVLLRH